jgi:CsoR family transcriptional regulator, copper-sensing transcriptional repressor
MDGRPGYSANKAKVLARLRRIEGQVRGIERMVEDERYCIDVLTQVSAAKAALESVSLALLEDHMYHCVADAIKAGDGTQKVREVSVAIGRLVRS